MLCTTFRFPRNYPSRALWILAVQELVPSAEEWTGERPTHAQLQGTYDSVYGVMMHTDNRIVCASWRDHSPEMVAGCLLQPDDHCFPVAMPEPASN